MNMQNLLWLMVVMIAMLQLPVRAGGASGARAAGAPPVMAPALAVQPCAARHAHRLAPGWRRKKAARRPLRPHYRAAQLQADSPVGLRSHAVLVLDPANGQVLFKKNADMVLPIASLTKLMTALVVIEANQDMDELLTVTDADVDRLKHSSSRLRVGARLSRSTMLHIALMSSENRAASALGRHYPGGTSAFVAAMNAKAGALGMTRTRYVEPTGLSSDNVSTSEDLAKLVVEAQRQPLIRNYSTDHAYTVRQAGRLTPYRNTNRLISNANWEIGVQKTGYIAEAGRCMVLHATIKGRPVVMVFLDAQGKFTRAADANRVRAWLAAAQR